MERPIASEFKHHASHYGKWVRLFECLMSLITLEQNSKIYASVDTPYARAIKHQTFQSFFGDLWSVMGIRETATIISTLFLFISNILNQDIIKFEFSFERLKLSKEQFSRQLSIVMRLMKKDVSQSERADGFVIDLFFCLFFYSRLLLYIHRSHLDFFNTLAVKTKV